jgi:hypothetical protein
MMEAPTPVLIALLLAWLQTAAPVWERKSAASSTDEELVLLLTSSPWAQMHQLKLPAAKGAPSGGFANPSVHLFLATAAPVRQAEQELRRRKMQASAAPESASDSEFEEFLAVNPGRYVVLAVRILRPDLLERPASIQKMEQDSRLKIGSRSYELVGYFLPTSEDPYLRLVFPRDVRDSDTELRFELYVPGVPLPFRTVRFELDKLVWHGRPEY